MSDQDDTPTQPEAEIPRQNPRGGIIQNVDDPIVQADVSVGSSGHDFANLFAENSLRDRKEFHRVFSEAVRLNKILREAHDAPLMLSGHLNRQIVRGATYIGERNFGAFLNFPEVQVELNSLTSSIEDDLRASLDLAIENDLHANLDLADEIIAKSAAIIDRNEERLSVLMEGWRDELDR